jgi:hypothetical protein
MAPSYYTVAQYVPDAVTDERVNIGVIAFDEHSIRPAFLRRWRRVSQFAGPLDVVPALRELAESFTDAASSESPWGAGPLTVDRITALTADWTHSVQFTVPRASTLDVDALIADIAPRLLVEPRARKRQFRDKRVAVTLAKRSLERALKGRPAANLALLTAADLDGDLAHHRFDLALANGRVKLAAQGLSFEGNPPHLQREVDATAWAIDDIRKRDAEVQLSVIALPPRSQSKTYTSAKRIFEGLDAEVVEESAADLWATASVLTLS